MSRPYMCGDEHNVYIPASADVDVHEICMTKVDSTEFAAVYHLTIDGNQIGDAIEIPKDKYLYAGAIQTVIVADEPYSGAEVGDKYIQLDVKHSPSIYIPLGFTTDIVYPVGNTIITSNPVNPSEEFGGSWQLVDVQFANFVYHTTTSQNGIQFDTTYANPSTGDQEIYVQRGGHELYVRGHFTATSDLTDSESFLVHLAPNILGGTLDQPISVPLWSDGANGYSYSSLATSGWLRSLDCISRNGTAVSGTIASGNTLYFGFVVTYLFDQTSSMGNIMNYDYCDKFFWKRTA